MVTVGRRAAAAAGLAAAFACGDGLAPGRRASFSIVPQFSEAAAAVLVGDLDRLRIRIALPRANNAVIDTLVPVDGDGNADLALSVPMYAESEDFEVLVEGIRSTPLPATVLYSGLVSVRVSTSVRATDVVVPVIYIGPCPAGDGCQIFAGPQGAFLAQGDSLQVTAAVFDVTGVPVPLVPVGLVSADTALVRLRPSGYVVARTGTPGGSALVFAQIRGDQDSLLITVQPPGGQVP